MKFVYEMWCASAFLAMSCECLRVLQATGYRPRRGYFKVVFTLYYLVLVAVGGVAFALRRVIASEIPVCVMYTLVAIILCLVPRKSPLKITKRVSRALFVEFGLLFCACTISIAGWSALLPLFVWSAWALCLPIDNCINKRYLKLAQAKLQKANVTVVAVTGSFGKTSTKEMLVALLKGSIAPSGSCNTPLGIAKFINCANFDNVEYLVLEFGARRCGDIAELCTWFKPKFGIVTGVCEQHLSTFKNLQNIKKTKSELVNMLPRDGVCILCDESVKDFVNVGVCKKVLEPCFSVNNVVVTAQGTTFSISDNCAVHLPQITHYSADTFAFCATMCELLGQSFDITVERIKLVRQVAHRMEISHNGQFYIIDDSYNASIAGVKACCKIVGSFVGKKVAISQGIVECGLQRKQMNIQCGEMLGKVFDAVVVLGKNKHDLFLGASKFCKNVVCVKNLRDAVGTAQKYLEPNGFLLFQNDLPDLVNV